MKKSETPKQNIVRDYYPLAEAAELSNLKVGDLIYYAATGQLQFYVMANYWSAKQIYGIKPGEPQKPLGEELLAIQNLGTWDTRDVTLGNTTFYGRLGPTKSLYELNANGLEPVASHCFEKYRADPDAVRVEIDINKMIGSSNKEIKLYFCPDPELTVTEALNQGKLHVMGKDLNRFLELESTAQLADLYDDPHWPEELGITLQAWLYASRNITPGQTPRKVMEEWLKEKYGHTLSKTAIERIATVANWNDDPGRPKKIDQE